MKKSRNSLIDFIRGLAMLMVVLGHTITGCTQNSENTFLYNIIWSLQMPLFMLISGYVTIYSAVPDSLSALLHFFLRKTTAYLLPWGVWTFGVRGFLFGEATYFDLSWLLYHMDSGYWFLFSLWTITLACGISAFLSSRLSKSVPIPTIFVTGIIYVAGMILLFGLTRIWGNTFLGLKQTLYYMLFYFAGYIWGHVSDLSLFHKYPRIKSFSIGICFTIFIYLLIRYNFYTLSDNLSGIIIRSIASFSGCIALCGFIKKQTSMTKIGSAFCWIGSHSLEIYLIHYLVLCCIKTADPTPLSSFSGFLLALINFIITILLSAGFSALLNRNSFLRKILFGKS